MNFKDSILGCVGSSVDNFNQPSFSELSELNFSSSLLSSKDPTIKQKAVLPYERPFTLKEIKTSDGHVIRLKPKQAFGEGMTEVDFKAGDDCGININELLDKIEYNDNLKKSDAVLLAVDKEPTIPGRNDILWAEKWRPRTFLELVGNERTNRYALRWLRRWSKCVFGEQVISERNTNAFPNASPYTDPFDRPEKRIMLIHGPPGIGKTTVAHVIAKQAGYEVMEINASDERAGQRVKDKIVNSLDTQTFSGKPVVLICDEVDGSTDGGFIRVLVDLVQNDLRATAKVNNKREGINKKEFNKSKAKSKLLMRPIICICNDLYASSLERLRPISEIVSFRKSGERTVQERLREICDKEGLTIDTKEIADIVALTNCDIRSCLNLLQFSGGSGSSDSRRKDSQINWFTIVKEIFKREPKITKRDQYNRLEKLISANNHNDRVVNGLFNLYHEVEYQDDLLYKPNEIGDWLFFFDHLNKSSFELQNSELGSYCSQVPMKFFLSFSDPNNNHEKKLKPRSDYEQYEMRRANMELQRRFLNHVDVIPRSKLILSNLSTQLIPFIVLLLTPEINSPRFNIKPNDKKKIDDALSILKEYGLTLESRKDESFAQSLDLYPAIDQITAFSNATSKKSLAKKASIYPLLVQELEKIRNLKRKLLEDEQLLEAKINKKPRGEEVQKKFTSTLDYFKSQYDDITNVVLLKKVVRDEESRIWVKFHEGFSNAVRKNITWDDLWNFHIEA